MKRKTNLFYTSGIDSNFITFSNYTEALTGNFLSLDHKLFPSKFICFNVPSLTIDTKQDFIKAMVASYENRLAYMRDRALWNNDAETPITYKMCPLEWLLESIMDFDANTKIKFISEIAEYNYNGVWSDIICTIDSTDKQRVYTLNKVDDTSANVINYIDENANELPISMLYGWEGPTGNNLLGSDDIYKDVMPNFLNTVVGYADESKYDSISIANSSSIENIEFNILVPLFDVINVEPYSNNTIINEKIDLTQQIGTDEENLINVPLGIWFANKTVSLNRDAETGYAPSWSIVLSTQFKPFPYSNKYDVSDITTTANTAAFQTFAQVFARQNEIYDKFASLELELSNINEKLKNVSGNASTSETISDTLLEEKLAELKNELKAEIDTIKISGGAPQWKARF